jgi:hypothetical protein
MKKLDFGTVRRDRSRRLKWLDADYDGSVHPAYIFSTLLQKNKIVLHLPA